MTIERMLGGALLFVAWTLSSVAAAADSATTAPSVKTPIKVQKTSCTPQLDNVAPSRGPVGTKITLTGRCFAPASEGRHMLSSAPQITISSWSDTQIVAVIGEKSVAQTYPMAVTVWYGDQARSSNSRAFTVTPLTTTLQAKPGVAVPKPVGLPQPQLKPGAFPTAQ